jgi:hypothetical protein
MCPGYYPNLTRHYLITERVPYNEIQKYVSYKLRPRKGTVDELGRSLWRPSSGSPSEAAGKTPDKKGKTSAKTPAKTSGKTPVKVPIKKEPETGHPMTTRGKGSGRSSSSREVEVIDLDDEEVADANLGGGNIRSCNFLIRLFCM